jgi:cytochrome P450
VAPYGPVVTLRRDKTFLLNSPDDIKRVLQDNHFNYRKGERYIRALEPLFGRGLLISEGDLWRRQRRAIQPAFYRGHHPDYAHAIVVTTEEWLGRWEAAARAGTPLDLRKQLMDLTLAVLMKTIFGRSSGQDIEAVGQAFRMAHREMRLVKAFLPVRLPTWIPTPSRARFARATGVLNDFIARIVNERRSSGQNGGDLIGLLLAARDQETGEAMSSQQIRDEVVSMLSAGHDTVTESLCWTMYLVAQHADVERRVSQEVTSVLGQRSPVAEDAKALTYTISVVEEAMRIYPPVWGMLRTAIEADVLSGYNIPAGARVVISPYVVHRSPSLWPEPERFDPDRFSPERVAGRHRFAYFPFGAGPRLCVGAQFAMLEVPLVAAMLWRRFAIRLAPGQTPRPLAQISLTADRPIWVHVTERRG